MNWQFSLRTLLVVMTAIAVVVVSGKLGGMGIAVVAVFVLLSIAIATRLRGATRGTFLTAYAAMYGPFVAMATYTLLNVACTHCKQTTWEVLPYGPGMVPLELVRHWLRLPWPSGVWQALLPALLSAGMLAALTWALGHGRWWWKAFCAVVGLALCSYFAVIVLAIIQA